MLNKIASAYRQQVFAPRWWSIFFNAFYFSRKGLHRAIARHAPAFSGRMLDFGCGSKPYRSLFTVKEYIGLDIQASGHDHMETQADVFYDGKTLPFADEFFDCALTAEVLEHVFNLDEILTELCRVLKPGAPVLITIPFGWDQHEVPYDFARYTEFGIRHLLQKHGFEILSIEKTATYVETLTQLAGTYLYKNLLLRKGIIFKLLRFVLITPLFVTGALWNKVLPDDGNFFLGQAILAKKAVRRSP